MSAGDVLVIDASAAVRAALVVGWEQLSAWKVHAPSLMWSEAAAAVRQLEWRGEITAPEALDTLNRVLQAEVESHHSGDLALDASALARGLGWAKTYDAEYIALARRLSVPLLTVDARLSVTATRLVRVLTPAEL